MARDLKEIEDKQLEDIELGRGIQTLLDSGEEKEENLSNEGRMKLRLFRNYNVGKGIQTLLDTGEISMEEVADNPRARARYQDFVHTPKTRREKLQQAVEGGEEPDIGPLANLDKPGKGSLIDLSDIAGEQTEPNPFQRYVAENLPQGVLNYLSDIQPTLGVATKVATANAVKPPMLREPDFWENLFGYALGVTPHILGARILTGGAIEGLGLTPYQTELTKEIVSTAFATSARVAAEEQVARPEDRRTFSELVGTVGWETLGAGTGQAVVGGGFAAAGGAARALQRAPGSNIPITIDDIVANNVGVRQALKRAEASLYGTPDEFPPGVMDHLADIVETEGQRAFRESLEQTITRPEQFLASRRALAPPATQPARRAAVIPEEFQSPDTRRSAAEQEFGIPGRQVEPEPAPAPAPKAEPEPATKAEARPGPSEEQIRRVQSNEEFVQRIDTVLEQVDKELTDFKGPPKARAELEAKAEEFRQIRSQLSEENRNILLEEGRKAAPQANRAPTIDEPAPKRVEVAPEPKIAQPVASSGFVKQGRQLPKKHVDAITEQGMNQRAKADIEERLGIKLLQKQNRQEIDPDKLAKYEEKLRSTPIKEGDRVPAEISQARITRLERSTMTGPERLFNNSRVMQARKAAGKAGFTKKEIAAERTRLGNEAYKLEGAVKNIERQRKIIEAYLGTENLSDDVRSILKQELISLGKREGPTARASSPLPEGLTAESRAGAATSPLKETPTTPARDLIKEQGISLGKPEEVITPKGTKAQTKFAIVDASYLKSSFDEGFPAELQNRLRGTRVASEAQIESIAGQLDPGQLGSSRVAASGAPIVDRAGNTLVRNGRLTALRRVLADDDTPAINYRDFLKERAAELGLDPKLADDLDAPVLVRVLDDDAVDSRSFIREANEDITQGLSVTERAIDDAGKLSDETLARLNPEDFELNESTDFVNRFSKEVVGPNELNEFVDAEGNLSAEGVRRIRNAVFAKAYNDVGVIEQVIESKDKDFINLGKALFESAPSIAKAKGGDFDLSDAITGALRQIREARRRRIRVDQQVFQRTIGGKAPDEVTAELALIMDANMKSPKKLSRFLSEVGNASSMADELSKTEALFGGEDNLRVGEVIEAVVRRVADEEGLTVPPKSAFHGSGVPAGAGRQTTKGTKAGRAGENLEVSPETLSVFAEAQGLGERVKNPKAYLGGLGKAGKEAGDEGEAAAYLGFEESRGDAAAEAQEFLRRNLQDAEELVDSLTKKNLKSEKGAVGNVRRVRNEDIYPESPTPEQIRSQNETIEEALAASEKMFPSLRQVANWTKEKLVSSTENFFKWEPMLKNHPDIHPLVRRFLAAPQSANRFGRDMVYGIMHPMLGDSSPQESYSVFKRYLAVKNELYAFEVGAKEKALGISSLKKKISKLSSQMEGFKDKRLKAAELKLKSLKKELTEAQAAPERPLRTFRNVTQEELEAEASKLESLFTPNIRKSVQLHQQAVDVMYKTHLYERGLAVTPTSPNRFYYTRQILDYMDRWRDSLPFLPHRVKRPSRFYTKERVGTARDINTDYMNVMLHTFSQMELDRQVEEFARTVAREKALGMDDFLKAVAHTERLPLEEVEALVQKTGPGAFLRTGRIYHLPDSSSLGKVRPGDTVPTRSYKVFRYNPTFRRFTGGTTEEQFIADILIEVDDELALPASTLLETRGDFLAALPIEIAERLEEFSRPRQYIPVVDDIVAATRWWKTFTTSTSLIPYQMNNFYGDAFMGFYLENPGAIKYIPRALKAIRSGQRNAGNRDFELFFNERIATAGATGELMPAQYDTRFRPFMKGSEVAVAEVKNLLTGNPANLIHTFNELREGTVRGALLLDAMEKIHKGQKVKSRIIPNIEKYYEKDIPGIVGREALVDYAKIGKGFARVARDLVFPFATWYYQTTVNLFSYIKRNPGDALVKLAAPYVGMQLWNNLKHPDVEKDLPNWARFQPHVNTGYQDEDGNNVVLTFGLPFNLLADATGIGYLADTAPKLVNGDVSPEEAVFGWLNSVEDGMKETAYFLLNPLFAASYEISQNKDSFGRPLVEEKEKGTSRAWLKYAGHFAERMFAPLAQIRRVSPDAPLIGGLSELEPGQERGVLRGLGYNPLSIERALPFIINRVDPEKGQLSQANSQYFEALPDYNSKLLRLRSAKFESIVKGDPSIYREAYNSVKLEKGVMPSVEALSRDQSSITARMDLVKMQWKNAKTPEEKEKYAKRYEMLQKERQEQSIKSKRKDLRGVFKKRN